MSYLDKLIDWGTFRKRDAPIKVDIQSPQAEITTLIRKQQLSLSQEIQRTDRMRNDLVNILAQQMVFVAQLEKVLERNQPKEDSIRTFYKFYRSVNIIKKQMLEALQKAGFDNVDLQEKTFDEVADMVEVDGWRHSSQFTGEVVAEVTAPAVCYQGHLIRQGIVIMGAPLEQEASIQEEV
ncbi:hypothetical protein KSC_039640 [Ktedonobacter sp. SOSP1-52]|uniref:hypothetical protein n=1 Tax=Ktedonobacter sp. SOSP1-52 TaxID=2778366 RepID=UPI0019154731|nr:hypothetical protein [Ktedonobacter sp. SOSP1-52]GHO65072.1 hypothetical protein KSC_039640 [Ktedonobacter sp. SOSP1-52]